MRSIPFIIFKLSIASYESLPDKFVDRVEGIGEVLLDIVVLHCSLIHRCRFTIRAEIGVSKVTLAKWWVIGTWSIARPRWEGN